jgi:hypothetical protein
VLAGLVASFEMADHGRTGAVGGLEAKTDAARAAPGQSMLISSQNTKLRGGTTYVRPST